MKSSLLLRALLVTSSLCILVFGFSLRKPEDDTFVYGTTDSPLLLPGSPAKISDARTSTNTRGSVVSSPTYIPLGKQQQNATGGNLFAAYSYVFNSVHTSRTDLILYPYTFSARTITNATMAFKEGAVISDDGAGGGFSFVTSATNIELARAKALYDSSIAILSVTGFYDGATRDLTYESSRYCSALHDYLVGKYLNCWTSAEYLAAIAQNPNLEATSVVYVTAADIASGFLFNNGLRRFGVLIISDIYSGSQSVIVESLGSTGLAQLTSFTTSGGMIYASGKGALVLSTAGLVDTTFDPTFVLGVRGSRAPVSGCDDAAVTGSVSEAEWMYRTLCFAPPRDDGSRAFTTLYTAPIVTSPNSMSVIASFAPRSDVVYVQSDIVSGTSTTIDISQKSYPCVLGRTLGSGYIVVELSNPTADSASYPWFYNALFLANSRPMIIDHAIVGDYDVLPALEQLALKINLVLTNLYDFSLNNFRGIIWLASGTTLLDMPDVCTLKNQTTLPQAQRLSAPNTLLDPTYYVDCSGSGSLAPFGVINVTLTIFIEDVSITQVQYGVVIAYPQVNYTDSARANLLIQVDFGAISINTFMAALIRTEMNVDPAGLYPLPGSGAYIDDVLTAQNTENTPALNTKYISIVPLISPMVDGNNEQIVIRTLEFDYLYYQKLTNLFSEYKYPFDTPAPPYGPGQGRDVDYLDWQILGLRNSHLVGDWDTPVKNFRVPRNTSFPSGLDVVEPSDVTNSQLTTTVTTDQDVLSETFFPDSDNFYELATNRLLAFLDTTDPKAFSSFNEATSWKGGVMEPWKLAASGDRMRSNLLLVHLDIYFYNVTQQYPLPEGIDSEAVVFTADNYNARGIPGPCVSKLGEQYSKIVKQGYFGNSYVDGSHFPPGLRASEYNNGILTLCDRRANLITWDEAENATKGQVTKTHYIVPLTDNPEITTGDDVMYFVADPKAPNEWYYDPGTLEGDSTYGTYHNVRLVWVYHSLFDITPESTRRGGRVTITFDGAISWDTLFDAVANGAITIQPDQVAITGTQQISQNSFSFTFKRGSMPNEGWGKPSHMGLNIEHLDCSDSSITATVMVEGLIYDLSIPEPHEAYETTAGPFGITLTRTLGLSLPALKMIYSLERGEFKNESTLLPYESLEPFVRFGTYVQELKQHSTVWADLEVHLNNPAGGQGLVAASGDPLWLSNMGISPIPFAEYMTTGQKQLIPSSSENSRVEWSDIWGRRFSQPVRSVYPDVAPLPGPLRNFMMSTTFQLVHDTSKDRELLWQSDESMVVHAQVKLLNNYVKWFDLTTCKDNEVLGSSAGTIYDTSVVSLEPNDTNWFVNVGHRAQYGVCMQEAPCILEGQELTADQSAQIASASLCIDGSDWYLNCPDLPDLPHLVHWDSSSGVDGGQAWNSIPQVESHYPEGYIIPSMWDITQRDHEDTPFYKSHPWHMDNNLPGVDCGIDKPQNIIAFALYKGLGYNMEYSKKLSHPRFPGKLGWWSDNLQNRDRTLLAGQSTVNEISVGQDDLTEKVGWVSAEDLFPDQSSKLRNIYTCNFNRFRVSVDPDNAVQSFPKNVYINNIVPIDPTLEKNDPRLSSYDCDVSSHMYFPENISQFDNYLATEASSDWLYFAANLRGEATETINVLMTLDPSPRSDVHQEGMTKVTDPARFVYWNPALGPNTFLVVDNLATVIMARRTDIRVEHDALPSETSTFNSSVIHILRLIDVDEVKRTWDSPIYSNYYGFGDSSISIYVGGYNNSKAILQPGDLTYIEIVFNNNAGFDWNLKATAINSTELESKPISANDLMYNLKHAIMVPTSYNFMEAEFEDPELEDWVTLWPSDQNVDTAPIFFDFENINVATVRDGFKGRYFYKLQINPLIPDKFKGQLHHIKLNLISDYFDALPGLATDPTPADYAKAHHDYTLSIPDIVFGIPYGTGSSYAGVVHWTSGHGYNLTFAHRVRNTHKPMDACITNREAVVALAQITGQPEDLIYNIQQFWKNLTSTCQHIPFTVKPADADYNLVTFNFTQLGSQFPFPVTPGSGPEIADLTMMLLTYADYLPSGRITVSPLTLVEFEDDVSKHKFDYNTTLDSVTVVGPFLNLELDGQLFDKNMKPLPNQTALDPDASGYVQLNLTATNTGNGVAYHVNLWFFVPVTLKVQDTNGYDTKVESITPAIVRFVLLTDFLLVPGQPIQASLLFKFSKAKQEDKVPNDDGTRVFLNASAGQFDLTPDPGVVTVTQNLNQQFTIPLVGTSDGFSAGILFCIIGIPILAVTALIGAGVTMAVVYKRKHKGTKTPSRAAAASKPAAAPKTPEDAPKVRRGVADMHYLMAGAKGVNIKNGNPTALSVEPPPEETKNLGFLAKVKRFLLCQWW
ncbi:hypothetical protein Pelo_1308 [Pelomyxa schiedti]|nr:hypothetical protein Pelo_1308 [Pelomyxa schiedti]